MRGADLESGYVAGEGWTAAIRGRIAVLVPASAADALVTQLWGPLGTEADLYAVLGVLTREHGLGDLPPFGILERGERLRLVVRGAVTARVTTPRGTEDVSGADVGTWAERAVDGWTGVHLEVVGPRATAGGGGRYPLADGAAAAVALFVGTAPVPAPPRPVESAGAPSLTLARPLEIAETPGEAPAAPAETTQMADTPPDPDSFLEETLTPFEPESAQTESPELESPEPESSQTEPPQPASTQPESWEPAAPITESTTGVTVGYDHLWEQTVIRRVEDAAVRPADEASDAPPAPSATESASEPHGPGEPQARDERQRASEPQNPSEPPSNTPAAPQLIHAVPWSHGISEQRRSITSELFGDHDGETILRSELEAAPEPVARTEAAAEVPPADAPLVLGRMCPTGHGNPPTNAQCRVCGAALAGEARQLPRPALGRVRFADGEVVELVEPLVVGRQPSVSRVPSGGMPRLVTVESPSGDISRNHLEVRLEGWHVMVRDLKATNGTVIEREGQPARRLGQGEMAIVLDGDVADLGDGVTLRFEDIP